MKGLLRPAVSVTLIGCALVRAAGPPVLTTHPLPQRVASGHRAELMAEAQFDPGLAWQWVKDGLPVPNSDNSRFTLRNARASDSGIYHAVARNNEGETWSQGVTVHVLHRSAESGAVDTEFADRFLNGTEVHAALVALDGSVVIGGDFTGVGSRAIGRVARLLDDGSLDGNFNPAGFGADGTVRALAEGDDGAIFIGGDFTAYNGTPAVCLARLHADGSHDGAFVPELDSHATEVRALARQPDGRLLVAGTSVNGAFTSHWLVRLLDDGQRDATFTTPSFLNGRINCLAIRPDGKIWLAGNFRQVPPGASGQFNRLARILENGASDPTFAPPGGTNAGANNELLALALLTDGRLVIGGRFTSLNGIARFGIARLSPAGIVDPAFNPAPDDFVHSILIEDSGSLIVGGAFTRIGNATLRSLARLRSDGAAATTLAPPGFNNSVSVLVGTVDGKLIVAGPFSQPHQLVARLHLDAPPDSAPSLVLAPAPATGTSTVPARLLAAFDGHPAPSIQWFKDGVLINGASGPEIVAGTPGEYFARATNSFGSVDSAPAAVALVRPSPGARPHWTLAGASIPQSMPDSGVLNLPRNVTGPGVIDEVRVSIDIVHPDASQLTADLISPIGTTVRLMDRAGRRGPNYHGTVFAAAAVMSVDDGVAPFVGTFAPLGSLASFEGQGAAGTWTLRVADGREDFLTGTVRGWSLELFSPAPSPSYQSWAAVHFPGNPPGSQPQDDHNQDGFANQLCYAFAQPPDFVPNADWDRVTSTLRHRRWVAVNDIAYVYEFSGGFGAWESAAPVTVYRRRFDDQTEEVMLVFPSRPPSSLGYFRVRAQ